MEEHLLTGPGVLAPSTRPTWLERIARRAMLRRLRGLRRGRLTLVEDGRQHVFGATGPECPLNVRLTVRDPAAFTRVAFGGTIGAGEAYLLGEFDADDLTGLVRLFVANREVMQGMEGGSAWLRNALAALAHRTRGHSRRTSRRNIAAHYDLGNDFFARFLDTRHGMYSSAVFDRPDATLEEAAEAKLARICAKLGLGPDDHVLDIGGGWGGFAAYAARTTGCRVTLTTISAAQAAGARERVAATGLQDRVTILEQDYRDLQGQYDHIVSIEMIEAIGHDAHATFFRHCAELLRPGGTMLVQAITIAEPLYEEARQAVDFIQRYIFPGGALPSVGALSRAAGKTPALQLAHFDEFGPHYALTLRHWRRRLRAEWGTLRAMGYSERFLRMWEFYFCYCEGGFLERSIGLGQFLYRKPSATDSRPYLPPWAVRTS